MTRLLERGRYSRRSSERHGLQMDPRVLPRALRVVNIIDGRKGLVLEGPETHGRHRMYRVAVEGSTRAELWPETQIRKLRKRSQLAALGGTFEPPLGYPHFTVRRREATQED